MFKRIAVHLDDDAACTRRVRAAAQAARDHAATLVGIYTSYLPPQYAYDEGIVPDDVYAVLQRRLTDNRNAARERLQQAAREAGVPVLWRAPEGSPAEALARHARTCDLLVLGQSGEDDPESVVTPYFTESVIMTLGRPVLIIPATGDLPPLGHNILFCWDQGREAARALSDADPVLRRANEVLALSVTSRPVAPAARDDLLDYFSAHGYPIPQRLVRDGHQSDVGRIILECADERGADLVIMGAYGHHRLREWVMGGACSAVLRAATVPVLLSH
ncbi:universal stress protein [Achromobacter aloeverae]|uniref:Universal stress protein n=1 Tax=Achromobacter aloeverae TaxID=1750518 RepID=A0A4Q1HCK3_9BURK|nr:universal stress protein [Achromobacter aloeverae]RXN83395.1 universal stress protein [Achromobacter aloeverae]